MSVTEEITRLKKLYELSMTLSGDPMDIFVHVARMIGELLCVKVVCLSEIRGRELYFLSVYIRGQIHLNAGSCPLEITPCATVEAKDIRIYDRVMDRFPMAIFLKDHNAFSYCGSIRWIWDRGFPIRDGTGLVTRYVGVAQYITERKKAEKTLRESEQRLELALMGADLGLWDWDIQTGAVFFNDRWANMLGYTLAEMQPQYDGWARLVHPDDMSRVKACGLLSNGKRVTTVPTHW